MLDARDWRIDPEERVSAVPGAVVVARLGDDIYYDRRFVCTDGCCESYRHTLPNGERRPLHSKIALMFIQFVKLVVCDGIDPQAAHREFLKTDQYRREFPNRRREQDLFGHWGSVWQVLRTSNGYRFTDPLECEPARRVWCKSENPARPRSEI